MHGDTHEDASTHTRRHMGAHVHTRTHTCTGAHHVHQVLMVSTVLSRLLFSEMKNKMSL